MLKVETIMYEKAWLIILTSIANLYSDIFNGICKKTNFWRSPAVVRCLQGLSSVNSPLTTP